MKERGQVNTGTVAPGKEAGGHEEWTKYLKGLVGSWRSGVPRNGASS